MIPRVRRRRIAAFAASALGASLLACVPDARPVAGGEPILHVAPKLARSIEGDGGERTRDAPPDALEGGVERVATMDPRLGALPGEVDQAVLDSLAEKRFPGCVIVIGRRDTILFAKAYGSRAIEPARVPMTLDTVFDLASLTKAVATTTSVMILAERGVIGLDEPVARYIPEFARNGKAAITVRHLLLHVSGLPSETPKGDFARGRDEAIRRISGLSLRTQPGAKFLYSDIGFILLGEIVRRVSGQDEAGFAAREIFGPLGMADTGYLPNEALKLRAAPTERRLDGWMQGEVHDPRAFLLGGVAGHAGLFSTGQDLAIFAQALLGGGATQGKRVLSEGSVAALFAPYDVPGAIRTLGWDVLSKFSQNRGDAFSRRTIGHGGYTGTSLWIDPEKDLFVVVLTNRVHPDGKGAVNPVASRVDTLAASALDPASPPPANLACDAGASDGEVRTGLDVLRAEGFARIRGAHVGLITNATGRARDGASGIDLFREAPGVKLVALFAPEHGLTTDREALIADGTDARTGLPVYSLYGDAFAPTDSSLEGIDTLVFDIQDVGTRFFTYASTMRRAMAVAAERRLRFVVLDRPNPIDGVDVSGPVLSVANHSFVNHHPLPVRHGMTMGELAELFLADDHMPVMLHVVRMQGWRRASYFDATGLAWTNPSPNLRSVGESLLYPGVGLLEGTNLSVGRGTDTPFEILGAPWIDGTQLAAAMTKLGLAGVTFLPASFVPMSSAYHGERCGGVRLTVTNRAQFEPVRTGLAIATQLRALYPKEWHFDDLDRLVADRRVLDAIDAQRSLSEVEALWADELRAFAAKREKYLLYPVACPAQTPPPADH